MNTHIIKKYTLSLKKETLKKFLYFTISIVYGAFIIVSLQLQFYLGSGDINAYIHFFDEAGNDASVLTLRGDYAFRIAVFALTEFFQQSTITILSCMGFLIASITFYIYSVKVRSKQYWIYILPLFLMVFFTPIVQVLFSSGIRSGIAFTVLMIAFVYGRGISKYLLFLLSSAIHLSMLPILSLYFLFYILNNKYFKTPFAVSLFLLLTGSFTIAVGASVVHVETEVSSSMLYNLLILYVGLLIIFVNKKAQKNLYGFMSVGLILIYISGLLIDASFIRYVGNAIILYLFFLIQKGEVKTIQVFSVGFAPFFLLTLYYSIANWI